MRPATGLFTREVAAAAALVLCSQAMAADRDGRYTVLGAPGLETCAEWLEVRGTEAVAAEQIKAWVAGFVSAYNRYAYDGRSVMGGRDPRELLAWAERFCHANPGVTVAAAAETMIQELNRTKER